MKATGEFLLREEEKVIYSLRALYQHYGYAPYKMSRFEEYDLYARNKDFLISDDIITFTDTNGKLMALKPDVTLSIVRNVRDNRTRKLYYTENVYRVSGSTRAYREMMQVGLECIGSIDKYLVCEVLTLAGESLLKISEDSVISISHMGIIAGILGDDIDKQTRRSVLNCVAEKNCHELRRICENAGIEEAMAEKLSRLTMTYGTPEQVLPVLREMGCDEATVDELQEITDCLSASGLKTRVNLDFSLVNDMGYYNGIVFKGYVPGVPTAVLSGGQYDRLMQKMGKKCGAIGFAVYMDALDRFFEIDSAYDVDTVLLYDDTTSITELTRAMRMLTKGGLTVTALKDIPEKLRYKQQIRIGEVQ